MNMFSKKFSKPGSAPGVLVAPRGAARESRIRMMHYAGEALEEKDVDFVEGVCPYVDSVIDSLSPLLEEHGDRIEELQKVLLDQPDQKVLESRAVWAWGYPAFWVAIILVGGGMIPYLKRKNWW